MSLTIEAFDDEGNCYGPIETAIDRPVDRAIEFTSQDLEGGNVEKGIEGIGEGVGDWQLFITLPIWTTLACMTPNGVAGGFSRMSHE